MFLSFSIVFLSSSFFLIKVHASENLSVNTSFSSSRPYMSKDISSYLIRLISSFKITSFSSKLILSESRLNLRSLNFLIKFAILFSKLLFPSIESLRFSAVSKTSEVSSLNSKIVFFLSIFSLLSLYCFIYLLKISLNSSILFLSLFNLSSTAGKNHVSINPASSFAFVKSSDSPDSLRFIFFTMDSHSL